MASIVNIIYNILLLRIKILKKIIKYNKISIYFFYKNTAIYPTSLYFDGVGYIFGKKRGVYYVLM